MDKGSHVSLKFQDKGSHVSLKFHDSHPKLKSVKMFFFFFLWETSLWDRPILLLKHKKTNQTEQGG